MFVLHNLSLCIAFAVIIKMEMVLVCNKEKEKKRFVNSQCVLENAFQPIHLRESNALGNLDCSPSAL